MGSVILAGLALSSCQGSGNLVPASVKMSNEIDTVSYCLGLNVGADLKKNIEATPGEKVNKDIFLYGLAQAMKGDTTDYMLYVDDVEELLKAYFTKLSEAQAEKAKEERMVALLRNDSILSANKAKEGVIVTESGLQYKVIKKGSGAKPKKEDVVKVHYTGKLADGTVFDSSYDRGEPAEFPVAAVIPGWTEALQLMNVGSTYSLVIPSNLAYGERGGGPIPPNSVLFFDVELIDIVKK